MTADTGQSVPELAAAAEMAAYGDHDVRLTFTPHRAGVHLVMGSKVAGPLLCGWVIGWVPGIPFPPDTDWSMVIEFGPYRLCRHPHQSVLW